MEVLEVDLRTMHETMYTIIVPTILGGMEFATLQSGEYGWVHPQCQKGDKLVRIM